MKVGNITLTEGLLVVKQQVEEETTKSGLILGQTDGDFIINGEVINSACKDYEVGSYVIYHVLDCEAFRDGKEEYHLLKEDKIKGVYARED